VSQPRKRDIYGAILAVGGAIAGLVGIFWLPFAFGPGAVIAVLIGALTSQTHTMLIRAATFTVGIAFVVGAALAVSGSHALY
jgi:ABC-type enterobactin transport system permease subunit